MVSVNTGLHRGISCCPVKGMLPESRRNALIPVTWDNPTVRCKYMITGNLGEPLGSNAHENEPTRVPGV